MSLGSQALERSALESKDRDSLVQIANAMGGKPASRAKKADIIDLILELAGVTAAAPADEASDAPSEDPTEASSDEHVEAAPAPSGRSRSTRSRTDRTDDAADVDRNDDDDDDVEEAEDRNERSDRSNRNDRSRGSGRQGERQPSGLDDRSSDRSDAGRDESADDGSPSSGQQPNGAGPREDGESGNRRRRRRGRDRDRNREGAPAGQPGSAPAPADDQWQGEPVEVAGLLDLRDEGYGFLRLNGYLPSRDDVYVSVKQVRQFGLRKGDHIKGASRPAARNEKNPALLRIDEVNAADPELNRERRHFEELTARYPDEQLVLERADDPADLTGRIIDLVAPVGKGQRGLIVAPPKSGKTGILKSIARSIEANDPEVHLMVLLVDERPEEVTDLTRSVQGEVVASTFDRPPEEHTMIAELALERAKRLVEEGQDVVILLDGLTRLARAYNLATPATGRALAGGIDTGALYPPKRFFGAARNAEEGGSLTILATVVVDSGSPMDAVIAEELGGTANLEVRLDRAMAERRIVPAIDVNASSSRHEDLIVSAEALPDIVKLRRELARLADEGASGAGLELLVERLQANPTNAAFLAEVAKG